MGHNRRSRSNLLNLVVYERSVDTGLLCFLPRIFAFKCQREGGAVRANLPAVVSDT